MRTVCDSFFWGNRVCFLMYTTQIKTSSLQLHGPGRFVPGFRLSSSSDHRRTLQRNFNFTIVFFREGTRFEGTTAFTCVAQ